MNPNECDIYVYAHWRNLPQPTLIGTLHATPSRGKTIFSFDYEATWLNSYDAFTLDPSLQLFHGRQYAPKQQDNFGIFLDSSPDRWGRLLMKRREAQLAREQHRKLRTLSEMDYLLGVYDQYRIGALRFKTDNQGPFLDQNKALAAPPWAALRELEQASLALEQYGADKDPNYLNWLTMLIAPGGSLGGARPKASVMDEQQQLWIAKFPSGQDEYDIGAWERVTNILANRAGITVANSQLKRLNHHHHTFLSQRFDRTNTNERIHFASAMTLLQHTDGDDAAKSVSYLELAEFIMQQSCQPIQDLNQLWRRIVFFICVSNVDDHLRNHGFIFQPQHGWMLSPAFDINPNPTGQGLTLNISETDNAQDLALAKEVADYFRIKPKQADEIIQQVIQAVRQWRCEATRLNISSSEQDQMAPAFRIVESFYL